MTLPAAIDRIQWLPTTLPDSPVSVHRAYWIWLALALPFTVLVHGVWDTGFWHATVRQIMGT